MSFDFRNMKSPLDTKRAHDSAVVRVAFVPLVGDSNGTLEQFGETMNATNMVTPLPPPAVRQKDTTESFSKFIDLCINKDQARQSPSSGKRDSFFDFAPAQNCHDFSMDSMAASPSRLSLGTDHSELRLKRGSRSSLNNSLLSDIAPVGHRRESLTSTVDAEHSRAVPSIIPSGSKRSRLTLNEPIPFQLEEIDEEERVDENDCGSAPLPDTVLRNKENRQCNQQDIDSFSKFIKDSHVSTPNNTATKSQVPTDSMNMNALRQMVSEIVDQRLETMENNVVRRICDRIYEAQSGINSFQHQYYWDGFKGNFNLAVRMEKRLDSLIEGMAVMLHDDDHALEYYRLQEENEELKRRLEQNNL